jgi:hypothetical protein
MLPEGDDVWIQGLTALALNIVYGPYLALTNLIC